MKLIPDATGDSTDGAVELSFAEVKMLHVAAAIATQVRRGSNRKVNVWKPKTGETIRRDVPLDEALIGIAKVHDLTFSVRDDAPQTVCAGWEGKCPKGARPPPKSFIPAKVASRRGEPWRCKPCACRRRSALITPERHAEVARKRLESMTPKQRSDMVREQHARRTPERAREIASKANMARTKEQRSEATRKAWATRRAKTAMAAPESPGERRVG